MPRISLPMPTPLARAARRFQEWREQRTTHRIPEELWTLAADLGRRYGVSRTARTLGVQYPDLKTRVDLVVTEAAALPEPHSSSPAFVEYLAPAPPPMCVIELEGARGARMRVQLQGADQSNMVAFARVFLEAQA